TGSRLEPDRLSPRQRRALDRLALGLLGRPEEARISTGGSDCGSRRGAARALGHATPVDLWQPGPLDVGLCAPEPPPLPPTPSHLGGSPFHIRAAQQGDRRRPACTSLCLPDDWRAPYAMAGRPTDVALLDAAAVLGASTPHTPNATAWRPCEFDGT